MPVGVIDVGSNTVRLHAIRAGRTVVSEREMLRLGADVERTGSISEERLDRAAAVVARFADHARAAGVGLLEILITSPGRQAANGRELLERLGAAADAPARILSAVEEGQLAFAGALDAATPPARRSVAVVDVGGGSAQIVVGTRRDGPRWAHSLEIGSQRLASRMRSDDPPGEQAMAEARLAVRGYLDGLEPPSPRTAYAVGGSARSLKRMAGGPLDTPVLEKLLGVLARAPSSEIGAQHDIGAERARTLAAGCVILAEIQRLLDAPLKVVRSGVREGALLELERSRAAA